MNWMIIIHDDDEEDLHEVYLSRSSSLRIDNRRWRDNGYVRAGRQEARPVYRPNLQASGAGPSREPRKKEAAPNEAVVGRRGKRALKHKLPVREMLQNTSGIC